MRNTFKGVTGSKLKYILTFIIVIAVTATACISLSMIGGGGFSGNKPDNSGFSQSQDSTNSESNTTSSIQNTAIDTSTSNNGESSDTNSTESNSQGNMPNGNFGGGGRGSSNNTLPLIILISVSVLGTAGLIIINVISIKKKKLQIVDLQSKGIPEGKIKTHFFVNTVVTILIAAVIGTGAGLALSGPISSAVMKNNMANFTQNKDNTNNFGSTDGSNNSSDNMGTPPSNNGENSQMPQNDGSSQDGKSSDNNSTDSDSSNSNNSNRTDKMNNVQSATSRYLINAGETMAIALVMAAISGLSATIAVSNCLDEEDDEEDDEDDDDE